MSADRDFVTLFLSHREPLWAFIRAMVRDYHACEDIFQQVALILWEQFSKYEPGTSFIAWSRAIALNKIRHAWRENKRLVQISSEAFEGLARAVTGAQDGGPPADQEQMDALRECVDSLSPKAQEIVKMRFDASSSLRALAEKCRTTVAGISMRLTRIRRELQRCVERRLVSEGGE